MTGNIPSTPAPVARHAFAQGRTATPWWRALLSSAALVLAVSPASAATIEAVFEGTVVNGFDTGGVFLPPGTLFSSVRPTFRARVTYDTSVGTPETPSSTVILVGGTAVGRPSPVLSAELTINGITEVIPTESFGAIGVGSDLFSLTTEGFLTASTFSSLDFFVGGPTFGANLNVTGTFTVSDDLVTNFRVRTNAPDAAIGGMLVNRLTLSLLTVAPPPPPPQPPQPPEVSVIPLPASALLLLAGLGALGVMRRRT